MLYGAGCEERTNSPSSPRLCVWARIILRCCMRCWAADVPFELRPVDRAESWLTTDSRRSISSGCGVEPARAGDDWGWRNRAGSSMAVVGNVVVGVVLVVVAVVVVAVVAAAAAVAVLPAPPAVDRERLRRRARADCCSRIDGVGER